MAVPSFFALAMVALLISSCDASSRGDAPGGSGSRGEEMMVIHGDPKCEVMVPCTVLDCTQYCVNNGLHQKGFCTLKPDYQVYCCCPVVDYA